MTMRRWPLGHAMTSRRSYCQHRRGGIGASRPVRSRTASFLVLQLFIASDDEQQSVLLDQLAAARIARSALVSAFSEQDDQRPAVEFGASIDNAGYCSRPAHNRYGSLALQRQRICVCI